MTAEDPYIDRLKRAITNQLRQLAIVRARHYRRVFAPEGVIDRDREVVLADLRDFCFANSTTFHSDPTVAAGRPRWPVAEVAAMIPRRQLLHGPCRASGPSNRFLSRRQGACSAPNHDAFRPRLERQGSTVRAAKARCDRCCAETPHNRGSKMSRKRETP